MNARRLALVLLVTIGTPAAAAPAPGGGYHVTKKITLPGQGTYYDYLFFDAGARRLYVTFGDQVLIFDPDKQVVVGNLAGTKKVHGVTVAGGKIFASDGGADVVRVYDAKTQKPLGEVPAGKNPDAIIYDPASKQVFAFNNHGGDATVIDPGTLKVTATIPLEGGPEFARADGKGTIWVNLEKQSQVVRIDSKKKTATAHWPLAPCEEPTGMAFDNKDRRLFIGCGNNMMAVVDADSGKVVTTLPIGPGVDATDYDPATKTVFNSCGGDGTLSVIHQDAKDKYSVVANVGTQKRARTMAVDPKTHRVFLSTAVYNTPAPTAQDPKPRGTLVPGTFTVIVVEK